MGSALYPTVTIQVPPASAGVVIWRFSDGKTYDTTARLFSLTPATRLTALAVSAANAELFAAQIDTTTLGSVFTDGWYIYIYYDTTNAPTLAYLGASTVYVQGATDLGPPAGVAVPANFASLAIDGAGRVTAGAVADKTGYALAQAFPANFASLGIGATGKISGVALVDTLTTYTGDTPQTGNAYALVSPLIAGGAFTAMALANAPAGGGGGGGTDWTTLERAQLRYRLGLDGAATQPSSAVPHLVAGDVAGAVPVDHNSGGPGNLAYIAAFNQAIGNGLVRAYLSADFAAGDRGDSAVQGESYTRADGSWIQPMMLRPGDYVFLFTKDGLTTAIEKRLTIVSG